MATAVKTLIARNDESFSFIYQENIDRLENVSFFDPERDVPCLDDVALLYLPGGYPVLHGQHLAANTSMKASILAAARAGMPIVAECGGFMYLQETLQDMDGADCPMTGLLEGSSEKKTRLVRFGYADMTAEKDSLLLRKGETYPIHEFHYWDTTNNGADCAAVKPVSGRSWRCAITGSSLFAGFPHLYFAGHPVLAERFVAAAAAYRPAEGGRS